MSQLQRARTEKAKEVRRSAILQAARALAEHQDFPAITMAAVARRAKVAKGTVFLYFPTRETLFLDLLDDLIGEWLGALHEAVAADARSWTSAGLAGLMTDTLRARPLLSRLLPLGGTVLEANVDAARVAAYRHRLVRRVFGTGALVEQRLALARRGDGVQLLLFALAMIRGLPPGADAPGMPGEEGAAARAPAVPEPDLGADLRTALTVLFNGFHRKGA